MRIKKLADYPHIRHHGQITENQMAHGGCNKYKIRNSSTIPPSTKQSGKMEMRSSADRSPQMLQRAQKIKVQAKTSCRVSWVTDCNAVRKYANSMSPKQTAG